MGYVSKCYPIMTDDDTEMLPDQIKPCEDEQFES